jgi:hypothetical protein
MESTAHEIDDIFCQLMNVRIRCGRFDCPNGHRTRAVMTSHINGGIVPLCEFKYCPVCNNVFRVSDCLKGI